MKEITELKTGWRIWDIAPVDRLASGEAERLSAEGGEAGALSYACDMPAQVHDVLLAAGVIRDPAMLGAPEEAKWVAERDWIYRLRFPARETDDRVFLRFGGLDTIADIYLNGEHIARNEDMYLPSRIDVTGKLRRANTLLLHFRSPHDYLSKLTLPPEWEGKIPKRRLIRKHDEDFYDYLGPKPYFTRMGIYDKVLLERIDRGEILEADLSAKLNGAFTEGRVTVKLRGAGDVNGRIALTLRDPEGLVAAAGEAAVSGGELWNAEAALLVENPRLWWPRGQGEHPLYRLEIALLDGGDKLDGIIRTIGFRTIEKRGDFDFYVNGRRIKLWGAQPAQVSGMTHVWNNEKSLRILDLAENCNMNAQRIWGGSDRYDDAYYEETDRRGILVWQEFFHGYSMLPDNEEYRALCRKEAEFQVKRLRHHPSVFMWCGGNECIMGAEYTLPGVPYIGGKLFLEDYAALCARLDPDRYYHPNSPFGGAFMNDPLTGDTHSYTNTWYVPGAEYPVLIAEEIRAAPPALKSVLRYFEGEEKAWPPGYDGKQKKNEALPWPETWLARTGTEGWLKIPPIERFYDADSLESMVYRFGAAHAWYLRAVLENNRRGRPWYQPDRERITKGHFVCRWNDSWPILYGSMLDYYLEPFQAYYATKRAYEPVLVSFDVGNFIHVWVVNDSPEAVRGTLEILLFDQKANVAVDSMSVPVAVMPGESKIAADLNAFRQFSRQHILFARLLDEDGGLITRTNDFVDLERHIRFPDARLSLSAEGDLLRIATDRFARNIELSGDEGGDAFGWVFEDNYFDLLPGEVKTVRVMGRHKKGVITAKPYYSTHIAKTEYH